MRKLIFSIPIVLLWMTVVMLVIALTGCECIQEHSLTSRVWNGGMFQHFREPALDPKIEVFTVPQQKDFLIVYDEVRDSAEDLHRRAFFLGANQCDLTAHRKPSFVNPQASENLETVPLNGQSNTFPFATYDKELAVHTKQGIIGPYELPTYEDKSGLVLRVLVSPFAITGDAVMGAALVGYVVGLMSVVGLMYLEGGGCGSL